MKGSGDAMNALDKLVGIYESRLAKLRQLTAIIGSDAAFAQEIVGALTQSATGGQPAGPVTQTGGNQLTRLCAFFRERGNSWLTTNEVIDGTGIPRGSIAPLLYRTQTRGIVESRKSPGQPKLRQWRLVQPSGDVTEASKEKDG